MNEVNKMKYHRIMYLLYKLYNQAIIDSVEDGINDIDILIQKLVAANQKAHPNIDHRCIIVKTIREVEDLTIDEFAKKCGFSKQFVSQMETGVRPISKKFIEKIKEVYPYTEHLFV